MRNDPRRRDAATYPWSTILETRFGDMDLYGHLNNVAIARLYEEGRLRFNAALHAQHPHLDPRYVVGHVAIDYLGEGRYPGPVTVRYGVASVGTASFRGAMALFQDDACLGLCDTVLVHRVDAAVAPLPPRLRAALGDWALRP